MMMMVAVVAMSMAAASTVAAEQTDFERFNEAFRASCLVHCGMDLNAKREAMIKNRGAVAEVNENCVKCFYELCDGEQKDNGMCPDEKEREYLERVCRPTHDLQSQQCYQAAIQYCVMKNCGDRHRMPICHNSRFQHGG